MHIPVISLMNCAINFRRFCRDSYGCHGLLPGLCSVTHVYGITGRAELGSCAICCAGGVRFFLCRGGLTREGGSVVFGSPGTSHPGGRPP